MLQGQVSQFLPSTKAILSPGVEHACHIILAPSLPPRALKMSVLVHTDQQTTMLCSNGK